jgi:hypothetical protein
LYFDDFSHGDRMAAALSALSGTVTTTTASSPSDFTTKLASGGYDLAIFFEQDFSGTDYNAAFAALATYIAGGGRAIADDWTRNNTHSAVFDTTFTGGRNQTSFSVTDPGLASGITNPVMLFNPGWGTFATDLGGGISAAVFPNSTSAIVSGNGGRSLFNGFLNDTFVDPATGEQLYMNEIEKLLGTTAAIPEPGTLTLLGLGIIGFARRRQASSK